MLQTSATIPTQGIVVASALKESRKGPGEAIIRADWSFSLIAVSWLHVTGTIVSRTATTRNCIEADFLPITKDHLEVVCYDKGIDVQGICRYMLGTSLLLVKGPLIIPWWQSFSLSRSIPETLQKSEGLP